MKAEIAEIKERLQIIRRYVDDKQEVESICRFVSFYVNSNQHEKALNLLRSAFDKYNLIY